MVLAAVGFGEVLEEGVSLSKLLFLALHIKVVDLQSPLFLFLVQLLVGHQDYIVVVHFVDDGEFPTLLGLGFLAQPPLVLFVESPPPVNLGFLVLPPFLKQLPNIGLLLAVLALLSEGVELPVLVRSEFLLLGDLLKNPSVTTTRGPEVKHGKLRAEVL